MKVILIGLLGIYLGYGAYYLIVQRSILYPRAAVPAWDVAADIPGLEKIWLDIPGGEVESWYLPPEGGNGGPVPGMIFFHGNGEVIDYWPRTFNDVRRLGIGVLLVEYPGYGRSEGRPTKTSINATALAAYDALVGHQGIDADRIVVYGRSLGGGPACTLVNQRKVAALVLQSTFTNTTWFGRQYLLPGFMVLDKFDNINGVKAYPGPVIVFHGRGDEMIPFSQAEQLTAAAQHGELVALDCEHSDCPDNYDEFWERIENFLIEEGILMDG